MLKQLKQALTDPFSDADGSGIDSCSDCGQSVLPGENRCLDCIDKRAD